LRVAGRRERSGLHLVACTLRRALSECRCSESLMGSEQSNMSEILCVSLQRGSGIKESVHENAPECNRKSIGSAVGVFTPAEFSS